jgi:hypothetical protein
MFVVCCQEKRSQTRLYCRARPVSPRSGVSTTRVTDTKVFLAKGDYIFLLSVSLRR